MRCLVTGTAGFVGFHVAKRLLQQGHEVIGIDGMVPYYDVKLKEARHAQLARQSGFAAHCCMLEDADQLKDLGKQCAPELVIHLAAQAGVRYGLENPRAYIDSNIVGTFNLLEMCRELAPKHVLIASTSSVYGANTDYPFAETDRTDHPLTHYAASKKAIEAIAHCYAHLWNLPTTVFRFFSAYGPWGRPDMALFKFTQSILAGRKIDVFNHGHIERDFTYIDDLVEAIARLCECIPSRGARSLVDTDSLSSVAPYRVVNVGGGRPVGLLQLIDALEHAVGRRADRNYVGMQLGDVVRTDASTELLQALIGYKPDTPLSVGVAAFVAWYREYYQV
jgi:UDP-glucuronate 4-epimerase